LTTLFVLLIIAIGSATADAAVADQNSQTSHGPDGTTRPGRTGARPNNGAVPTQPTPTSPPGYGCLPALPGPDLSVRAMGSGEV
jgi:hypothetical protein